MITLVFSLTRSLSLVMRLGIAKGSIGNVPMQVSLDATATTGRLHTRKSGEEEIRTFYDVPASSSKVVKVKKLKSNIKNKNMNPEIKIDMRDTFIKELVEVNGLPQYARY